MDYVKMIEEHSEEIQTDYIKDIRDNNCLPSVMGLKVEEYIKKIEKGDLDIPESYEMDYIDKHFPFQNEEMDIEEMDIVEIVEQIKAR